MADTPDRAEPIEAPACHAATAALITLSAGQIPAGGFNNGIALPGRTRGLPTGADRNPTGACVDRTVARSLLNDAALTRPPSGSANNHTRPAGPCPAGWTRRSESTTDTGAPSTCAA